MRTIETTGIIGKTGRLKLDGTLNAKNQKVKVIIFLADNNEQKEEKTWLKGISSNPAFGFLKDKEEDIYTLTAGTPFNG